MWLGGSQAVEGPAGMKHPAAPCCKLAHGQAAWQGVLRHEFQDPDACSAFSASSAIPELLMSQSSIQFSGVSAVGCPCLAFPEEMHLPDVRWNVLLHSCHFSPWSGGPQC